MIWLNHTVSGATFVGDYILIVQLIENSVIVETLAQYDEVGCGALLEQFAIETMVVIPIVLFSIISSLNHSIFVQP